MDLYRKILKNLDLWRETNSALIVYGSRQVGKTYTLKLYISKNFKKMFYINLFNNIQAIKTIIDAKTIDDFIMRLSLLGEDEIDNDTCIFIDEVQAYYTYLAKHRDIEEYFDIVYQTKTFVTENKNRIVLSGSLLRLELNNLITAPTGYLLQLEMYPLDFEEYLINSNIPQNVIDITKECINKFEQVPDYIHSKLISKLNEYILVGGMPEAVDNFLSNKNFQNLAIVHKKIEDYFVMDITQYAEDNEKLKIKEIYNLIPTELSNPTRKFIISDIPGHSRGVNEVLSFSWLTNAGITIPVYMTSEPTIPLITNSKRNQFKLFLEDIGLLSYKMFNSQSKLAILDNMINPNMGFIFENYVAQELHAHGFAFKYYYNNRKYGEIDFILESDYKVLPIEVKSGKNNSYHRALNNIMDVKNYSIEKAIVLSHENTKIIDKIIYLPIYAISFLNILNKEY